MSKENDYVDHFYGKYHGRVAIGVGYDHNLSEIYPLVFQNAEGESIGIVALGVIPEGRNGVYIYHLGAFISRCGNGSKILKELCYQADKFKVYLSVSAISIPNGKDPKMDYKRLIQWYMGFDFKGDSGLLREPQATPGA